MHRRVIESSTNQKTKEEKEFEESKKKDKKSALVLNSISADGKHRDYKTNTLEVKGKEWRLVYFELLFDYKCKYVSYQKPDTKEEKNDEFKTEHDFKPYVKNRAAVTIWDEEFYDPKNFTIEASSGIGYVNGKLPFYVPYVRYVCVCKFFPENARNKCAYENFHVRKLIRIQKDDNPTVAHVRHMVLNELKCDATKFELLKEEYLRKKKIYLKLILNDKNKPLTTVQRVEKFEELKRITESFSESETFDGKYLLAVCPSEGVASQNLWKDCYLRGKTIWSSLCRHWILYRCYPNLAERIFLEMSSDKKNEACRALMDSTQNWKYRFPSETLKLDPLFFGGDLKDAEGTKFSDKIKSLKEEGEEIYGDLKKEMEASLNHHKNKSIKENLVGKVEDLGEPDSCSHFFQIANKGNKAFNYEVYERLRVLTKNKCDTAFVMDAVQEHVKSSLKITTELLSDCTKDLVSAGILLDAKTEYPELKRKIPSGTYTFHHYRSHERELLNFFIKLKNRFEEKRNNCSGLDGVTDGLSNQSYYVRTALDLFPSVYERCALSENQKDAVLASIFVPLLILVGLPGTGKTETMKAIKMLHEETQDIVSKRFMDLQRREEKMEDETKEKGNIQSSEMLSGGDVEEEFITLGFSKIKLDPTKTGTVATVTHGGCMASELRKKGLVGSKTICKTLVLREKALLKRKQERSAGTNTEKDYHDQVKLLMIDEFSNVSDELGSRILSLEVFPNLSRVVLVFDQYQTAPIEEGRLAINLLMSCSKLNLDMKREINEAFTRRHEVLGDDLFRFKSFPSFAVSAVLTENFRFSDGKGDLAHNDACLLNKEFELLRMPKVPESLMTLVSRNSARFLKFEGLTKNQTKDKMDLSGVNSLSQMEHKQNEKGLLEKERNENIEKTEKAFDALGSCKWWPLELLDDRDDAYKEPMKMVREKRISAQGKMRSKNAVDTAESMLKYVGDNSLAKFILSEYMYDFEIMVEEIDYNFKCRKMGQDAAEILLDPVRIKRFDREGNNQFLALTNDDCTRVNNICKSAFFAALSVCSEQYAAEGPGIYHNKYGYCVKGTEIDLIIEGMVHTPKWNQTAVRAIPLPGTAQLWRNAVRVFEQAMMRKVKDEKWLKKHYLEPSRITRKKMKRQIRRMLRNFYEIGHVSTHKKNESPTIEILPITESLMPPESRLFKAGISPVKDFKFYRGHKVMLRKNKESSYLSTISVKCSAKLNHRDRLTMPKEKLKPKETEPQTSKTQMQSENIDLNNDNNDNIVTEDTNLVVSTESHHNSSNNNNNNIVYTPKTLAEKTSPTYTKKGPFMDEVNNGDSKTFIGYAYYYRGNIGKHYVEWFLNLKKNLLTSLGARLKRSFKTEYTTNKCIEKVSEAIKILIPCDSNKKWGVKNNDNKPPTKSDIKQKKKRAAYKKYLLSIYRLLDDNRWFSPQKLKNWECHMTYVTIKETEGTFGLYSEYVDTNFISFESVAMGDRMVEYTEWLCSENWVPSFMGKDMEDVCDPFIAHDSLANYNQANKNIFDTFVKHRAEPRFVVPVVLLGEKEKDGSLGSNTTMVDFTYGSDTSENEFSCSDIEDGWCITVNLAQGKQYDRVCLVMPEKRTMRSEAKSPKKRNPLPLFLQSTFTVKNISGIYSGFDLSHSHVAISRPKKEFILFGNISDFIALSGKNSDVYECRYSLLRYKLPHLFSSFERENKSARKTTASSQVNSKEFVYEKEKDENRFGTISYNLNTKI